MYYLFVNPFGFADNSMLCSSENNKYNFVFSTASAPEGNTELKDQF